jgi:phage tail-like protein
VTDSIFPSYHFATAAQWQSGLSTGVAGRLELDPEGGEADGGGAGCGPLVVGPDGTGYWTEDGLLISDGIRGPRLGAIGRLVLTGNFLWALAGGSLVQLDAASLQQLMMLPDGDVIDIAAALQGGLWLLRRDRIDQIDACGHACGKPLPGVAGATQIAAACGVLALLVPDASELHLVSEAGTVVIDLAACADRVSAFRPAGLLAGRDAFLISGDTSFLLLGCDGSLLLGGVWKDGVTPGALALAGSDLIAVFQANGVSQRRRFREAGAGGGLLRLTPALESETLAGGWLRAEVMACLPEGATLEVRFAATSEDSLATVIAAIAVDPAKAKSERLRLIQQLLDPYWSPTFFYSGVAHKGEVPLESFGVPLHAAHGPLLWVELMVRRNQAAADPSVAALSVFPAGESLMDHLPAIYRGNGDRDGTMRRLVGVLEATTLGIDAEIARLGDRLDPARTEDRWLGSLAAMLGLPFDAALSTQMQRGLVKAAPDILLRRGTVAGVRALLEALFPGRPITVTDRAEQLAPITLGGGGCDGSRLPALLAGPTSRLPRLNARLVLGTTRLCPASPCDTGLVAPPSEVRVTIPATGTERRDYENAVRQMAEAMIPAGVILRLRWTAWHGRQGVLPEDWLTTVDAAVHLRLGDGQALGTARLGGRRVSRLNADGAVTATIGML